MMLSKWQRILITAILAVAAGLSATVHAHGEHGKSMGTSAATKQISTTAAFDNNGRLWTVWAEGKHVLVRSSDDLGHTLSPPVTINPTPEPIYADGENRPKIIASPDGALYVSYSMPLKEPYTGFVRFSRSLDGGKTWSAPLTVHHDQQQITHRLDSLFVDAKGNIFVIWVDERDKDIALKAHKKYDGAATYYAVSTDRGASFQPERKVADQTCECCGMVMAADAAGDAYALWRHIYPGQIRDHAIAKLNTDSQPLNVKRATFSNWEIAACPHHGPTLAIAPDGVRHMAWFGDVKGNLNIYYSRLSADGKSLGEPWAFAGEQASHPALLFHNQTLWLAWKYFDGKVLHIMMRRSTDGGLHWSDAESLAQTAAASDHPQLLSHGDQAYLSWRTQGDGYRLIPLSKKGS